MRFWAITLLTILLGMNSQAQTHPPFNQLRYEEDYKYLKNDTSNNWYTAIKFIPLDKRKDSYLSVGGDIRYQYQWLKNADWGQATPDYDGFILTRYLLHIDLHTGTRFRTFVQLQSSLANGKSSTPTPIDENLLDIHQVFADFSFPLIDSRLITLRLGRQEFLYGSQRLVAVREGPNNRQSFDGAKLLYASEKWNTDLFFSHQVRSRSGIFDDRINRATSFWGAYLTNKHIPCLQNADLYYLGLRREQAAFDDGTGSELRHSIGSRIWGTTGNWHYDIEGLFQFGRFAEKKIHAWTFSINTGYRLRTIKFRPEIGIKTELISGDRKMNDRNLQTFNALFPRGAYFGLASVIGPSNLMDIHPSLSFNLTQNLLLSMDCDIFWRYSQNDGIYGPNTALIYSGHSIKSRSIGRQYSTDLVFTPNKFLHFSGEFSWFQPGDFLKEVSPGREILFTAVTAQLKF